MLLWVGLGNPDRSMQNNRHNIGFMVVEALAKHFGGNEVTRAKGVVVPIFIGHTKILLLRPMTYMNCSGESVQKLAHYYKIQPQDITVFHDDLDLNPGDVRIKLGGGTAGHNGLKSITSCLGDPNYWRVRIGIGHPGHRARVHGWVLGNFTTEECQNWRDGLLEKIVENSPLLAQGEREEFQKKIKNS